MTGKQGWKNKPLTNKADKLNLDWKFTNEEFIKISNGHKPVDMDDRWFIYFEDNNLHFHRSWTGHEIFRLNIIRTSDKNFFVKECWIERDENIFNSKDDKENIDTIRQIIDNKLLH